MGNNQIIESLEVLKKFFEVHKINVWVKRTEVAIGKLEENNGNSKSIMNDFIGAGMGSLIDLYVCEDNGHVLKENEFETNNKLIGLTEEILTIKNRL